MFNKLFAIILAFITLPCIPAFAGTNAAVSSSPSSLTHYFTSSTTDTVPSWAHGMYVTVIGGGGGGGSGLGGYSATVWDGVFVPVIPGNTLTITIGTGGAATAVGGATSVTGGGGPDAPPACGGSSQSLGAKCGTYITWPNVQAGNSQALGSGPPVDARFFPGQSWAGSATVTCLYTNNATTAWGGCSAYGGAGAGYGYGGTNNGVGGPGLAIVTYVQ